ncbi:thiolase family protein [Patescibacteria group bacterium]|nr:thiolase family protein [Patescibacteria group bacterium]
MDAVYITGSCRTPIGCKDGAFKDIPATTLAAIVFKESIRRSKIDPHLIDHVDLGNMLTTGLGPGTAWQAAFLAGLPEHIPTSSHEKRCGSGMEAVRIGWMRILAGTSRINLVGGTENMTRAPYYFRGVKIDKKQQSTTIPTANIKSVLWDDGLKCPFTGRVMGELAENCKLFINDTEYQYSREEMDFFTHRSYQLALEAQAKGYFAKEIVPVRDPQLGPDSGYSLTEDEEPKKYDIVKINNAESRYKKPDGLLTDVSSSKISDGAASMMLFSEDARLLYGITPEARIIDIAESKCKPEEFSNEPINAVRKLNFDYKNADLFEVNEAFIKTEISFIRALNVDPAIVNVSGGAVALGHPLGASGARIIVALIHNLKRLHKRYGIAAICIGGGEALAIALEVL